MATPVASPEIDRCWQKIGIWGDRTCSELTSAIHCRNCPAYITAGRNLLAREVTESVLRDWNQAQDFQALKTRSAHSMLSVIIFQLATEWFALSTAVFQEVIPSPILRTIPHRSNQLLQGVVNVRGELQLCISLPALLGLTHTAPETSPSLASGRMVVIEQQGDRWVFAVDAIASIAHFPISDLQASPAAIAQAPETYTKGVLHWGDRFISLLDEELLFYRLNHQILG
jgi:chemotaxis-related protein WspD